MTDILEELKRGAEMEEEYDADGIIRIGYKRSLRYRAADEIKRLRDVANRGGHLAVANAEIERLRDILRECDLALSYIPQPTKTLRALRERIRDACEDKP